MRFDRLQATRWLTLIMGIITVLTGLALVFAPEWFFVHIGYYPPFNRHYEGDLGMFNLGIGAGLILAWRDPRRHRLMIGAAALGNVLHVLNHVYDSIISRATLAHWVSDGGPVLIGAVALVLAWWWAEPVDAAG